MDKYEPSIFQLNVLIDTSALLTDLMSLRNDKFIDAKLLEVQGINCVRSLLMTPNAYSIMDVKSKHLENFKKDMVIYKMIIHLF